MHLWRSYYNNAPIMRPEIVKWGLIETTVSMASEIFGIAAVFWVLIPVGLAGGALLLKLQKD